MTSAAQTSRVRKAGPPDIGHGRPPRAYQFKPGESGNPRGRPRGRKNEATILNELLNRKIPVQQGGKTRRVTILEAILLRFTEDSLKGNTKSAAFLLNRHSAFANAGSLPETDDQLTHDDRDVLEAFARKLLSKKGKSK
jgi:hypothetical protein